MSISSSEEMCLTFQHSTHIAHEMYIKKEKLVDRNLRQKSHKREIVGIGRDLDFNTVIYIVKMAHSAHLFNQDFDDASNDRIQRLFREPKLYYFPHIVFCIL